MRQLCVHQNMKHLGNLESTQEVKFGLLRIFCALSKRPACYLDEPTFITEVTFLHG